MEPIYVTKTFLPPIEEFQEMLAEIWRTHLVTNDGPFFQEFETKLRKYTNIDNVVCVGNGTLALQIIVRTLNLQGEIITSPFSHVATSGSMVWEGCKPVFVDIDPYTYNINPDLIEEKINEKTSAILPVHVYSNPCDIERIQAIADRHHLKVIYDAAHAFGVNYKGKSIFAYGDISMASFNATKALHSIEGGALFSKEKENVEQIRKLAYFGMNTKKEITQQYGTNAKMIEFAAAIGILNLKYFDSNLKIEKELYELYAEELGTNRHIQLQKINEEINYSYFPAVFDNEQNKDNVIMALNAARIYPREYFKPSLELIFSEGGAITCPVAYDISNRVLCLPMSSYLSKEDVFRICGIIKNTLK
jgi:dTDP-4-amino-4,6-dideoxygalactose transaminase